MGEGSDRSSQVRGPDDYWRNPKFANKYVRRQVEVLGKKNHLTEYNFQCMMALAQGITYLSSEPKIVLEAGCGPAIKTVEMRAKYLPNSTIVGCDYSEIMLHNAETIITNVPQEMRVRVDKANVYDLPYEDEAFDVVYSYGLLMGLTEPAKAIEEIMRVSKTGFVTIEEAPEVMGPQQTTYWTHYKTEVFPGRVYWHNYLKLFSSYKNVNFTPIPIDVFEDDEYQKIPPGYARFIVTK